MKTLIIIRHAKSSWKLMVFDKDRDLTSKGIANIKTVAKNYKSILPDSFTIWSSTAKRAHTTAVLFAEEIGISTENIILNDKLYTFDNIDLEKIIKTCDDSIENLVLFGHNSAITDFVNKFGDIYIENVPTSGLVQIDFNSDSWKHIKDGVVKKVLKAKHLS